MALKDPLTEWAELLASASYPELAKLLIDQGALRMVDLNALLAERTQYWPLGGQLRLHMREGMRIKVAAGGWRSGKSRWTGREVTYPLVRKPKAAGWIIGKDYELARPEFKYVVRDIQALGYPAIVDLSDPQQGRWRLVLENGSTLQTQSAEDIGKIEAETLDVVALVEAGSLTEELLVAAIGRIVERRGLAVLSGRFRGSHNWYTDIWREGQVEDNVRRIASESLRTWDNRFFFPPCEEKTCVLVTGWPPRHPRETHGGFHNDEIQLNLNSMTEDNFGEMFAAEPRPDRTLVYGEWWDRRTHMVPMTFEENLDGPVPVRDGGGKVIGWRLPVGRDLEVWVDPGYAGAYAVLVVYIVGEMVFVIDEIYVKGFVGPDVCGIVKRRKYFPYIKSGVIDVAGKQHAAMPNQVEVWLKETEIYLRSQVVLVPDGIERVRTILRSPKTKRTRIYFNTVCTQTAMEMEAGYRYALPRSDDDPRADKENPIEKDNHACSALAYGLVMTFGKNDLSRMTEPKATRY